MHTIAKKNHAAFSLFELVIALALMILLFSMVTTIFRAGMTTYAHHDRGLFPYSEARDIFRIIEDDIQRLIPSASGGTNSELFRGEMTRMRYATISPEHNLMAILYSFNATNNTLERSVQEIATLGGLPNSDTFTDADIIGSNIMACSFTYYTGAFSGLTMTTGYSNWGTSSPAPIDAPSEMPMAVQVTVTIADTKDPSIQETFSRLFAIQNRIQ